MVRTKPIYLLVWLAVLLLIVSNAVPQDTSDNKLPNFHKVTDKLYRGAQPKPGGLSTVSRLGIKTIINLRDDDQRAKDEESEARTAGLRYFNIPVGRWGRPVDADIDRVMSIITDPENQPVFVHCQRGADRTGVVIAVYRIAHDGWTSEQAKDEAKHYGLKPWQIGMKDYIHDFNARYVETHKPAKQGP